MGPGTGHLTHIQPDWCSGGTSLPENLLNRFPFRMPEKAYSFLILLLLLMAGKDVVTLRLCIITVSHEQISLSEAN